ncbi:MAG: hypothetical protein HZA14_07035 [Nitrospirae bacterium]|nr:hypothetical protein [Nitrospirota bacterium]
MPYKKVKSVNKGMTVVYSGDSNVLIKKDGTLAWRNNNPGNIISGPFAKRRGAIGENKGFAVFPDTETGRKAQYSLLKNSDYQSKTIDGAMKKYADPKHNPTEKYIQYVSKQTGMSRDKNLSNLTPKEFEKFTEAIRRFEKLTPGTEVTLPHPDKHKSILHSPMTPKIPSRHVEVFRHRNLGAHNNSGGTLKREGDKVWRIDPDGSTRGYFICND